MSYVCNAEQVVALVDASDALSADPDLDIPALNSLFLRDTRHGEGLDLMIVKLNEV